MTSILLKTIYCCLGFGNGILFVCVWLLQLRNGYVECHGRLMEPPARNSMWRFGYPNPVDYNDNELYCGGYSVQWLQNGGKCGICGDAYNAKEPRPHEAGGQFGRGIISRHYFAGQVIDIVVELTSNHRGRFELYLCPNNNPKREATQSCFDRYPLYVQGSREVRYFIPADSAKKETFYYKVKLPPYLTCSQCVLQWTYYTANTWGMCDNGTEGLGCGQVETFRNCADIRIVSSSSGLPPQFVNELGYGELYREYASKSGPLLSYPNVIQSQVCKATKNYKIIPGMDKWCQANCVNYPSTCPEDFCFCPSSCFGRGEIKDIQGADEYCQDQCLVYGGKCPPEKCYCI